MVSKCSNCFRHWANVELDNTFSVLTKISENTKMDESGNADLQEKEVVKINIRTNRKVGKGMYGTVFEYIFGGKQVAVKRIQLLELDNVGTREVKAMSKLSHPNVLTLIEEQEDADFMYLVLEWCIGTVQDYMNKNSSIDDKNMPSEPSALHQMASGLHYIHSQGFVHRDIKPANVLISPSFVLKISDFGLSKPTSSTGSFSNSSNPGTPNYTAPECLQLNDKSEEEIRQIRAKLSIDTFSLGCLFFSYIKRGGHLFEDPVSKERFAIPSNIVNGTKFLDQGLEKNHYAYDIIDGMTRPKHEDRMELTKVIEILEKALLK